MRSTPPTRITDARAHDLRLPQIEARTDSSPDALIVEVSTDAGIIGWGEVDSCPAVIQAVIEAAVSHTLVTGLKRILIGEDPLDTTLLRHNMARSTLYRLWPRRCDREGGGRNRPRLAGHQGQGAAAAGL